MRLTKAELIALEAVEAGCTRPRHLEIVLKKSQNNVLNVLSRLKLLGVVEKNGKDWVIIKDDWRARHLEQKKPLEPTLQKLVKVLCWTIDEADARGISRSDIDVMRVLNACRELDVPEFSFE